MRIAGQWLRKDITWVFVSPYEVELDFVVGDEFANIVVADVDVFDFRMGLHRLCQMDQASVIAPHIGQFLLG